MHLAALGSALAIMKLKLQCRETTTATLPKSSSFVCWLCGMDAIQ